MLFHARLDIAVPRGMDPEVRADLFERDRSYLARAEGVRRLQAVGEQVEFLLIEAADHEQVHTWLAERPLARFATITLTAVTAPR